MAAIKRSCLRGWRSIACPIGQLWRKIEPGISIQDSFIEAWSGEAEGDATCISFEGFGVSAVIIIGRTPTALQS